jgi:hypothetical protein
MTYCSLNAFTGGLNDKEQGETFSVGGSVGEQEMYLLSSTWSTFSDGKLMARCLNREAYGGAVGCMATETDRCSGESSIVGHRIAIEDYPIQWSP